MIIKKPLSFRQDRNSLSTILSTIMKCSPAIIAASISINTWAETSSTTCCTGTCPPAKKITINKEDEAYYDLVRSTDPEARQREIDALTAEQNTDSEDDSDFSESSTSDSSTSDSSTSESSTSESSTSESSTSESSTSESSTSESSTSESSTSEATTSEATTSEATTPETTTSDSSTSEATTSEATTSETTTSDSSTSETTTSEATTSEATTSETTTSETTTSETTTSETTTSEATTSEATTSEATTSEATTSETTTSETTTSEATTSEATTSEATTSETTTSETTTSETTTSESTTSESSTSESSTSDSSDTDNDESSNTITASTEAVAIAAVAPIVSTGTMAAHLSRQAAIMANTSISDHFNGQSGVNTGSSFADTNVWGSIRYITGNNEDEVSGKYNLDSVGFTLGYDYTFSDYEDLVVGAAFSYYNGNVDRNSSGLKLEQNLWMGSLYSKFAMNQFDVLTAIHFAQGTNQQGRNTNETNIKGEYDNQLWGITLQSGYTCANEYVDIRPVVEFNYLKNETDKFDESKNGSETIYNIAAGGLEVMELGGGLKLSKMIETGDRGNLHLHGSLMAYHDFNDDKQNINITTIGSSSDTWTVINGTKDQERYRAGLGIDLMTSENVSIDLNYDYLWNQESTVNAFSCKLNYLF